MVRIWSPLILWSLVCCHIKILSTNIQIYYEPFLAAAFLSTFCYLWHIWNCLRNVKVQTVLSCGHYHVSHHTGWPDSTRTSQHQGPPQCGRVSPGSWSQSWPTGQGGDRKRQCCAFKPMLCQWHFMPPVKLGILNILPFWLYVECS